MSAAQGKVIVFPSNRLSKPFANKAAAEVITQERLRKALHLQAEEARIVREAREYALALQADLATGASIEDGELTFNSQIRAVARKRQERLGS